MISLWTHKQESRRTFSTADRVRCTRNNWNKSRFGVSERKSIVREYVEAIVDISHSSAVSNDHLDTRKLTARWVSRLLTSKHKRNRMTTLKEEFLCCFISVDKTWTHYNIPETKQKTTQFLRANQAKESQVEFVSQQSHYIFFEIHSLKFKSFAL